MDEIAYRGHKRGDIDGQSDIASLILPPLSPSHISPWPPDTPPHLLYLSSSLSSALSQAFCLRSLIFSSLAALPLAARSSLVITGSYVALCRCFS